MHKSNNMDSPYKKNPQFYIALKPEWIKNSEIGYQLN